MTSLVFDTETTGLPNYKAPVNDKSQPYIVQLAAILLDDNDETIMEFNTIIQPEGWTVPEAAAAVHGITTDKAQRYGIPILSALHIFKKMYDKADYLVAHNIDFDLRMLRRYFPSDEECDFLKGMVTYYDTKTALTDIMQLPLTEKQLAAQKRNPGWSPPGGWPKYKDPTMSEAYGFFFMEELDGAHSAMVDAMACADVFTQLKQKHNLPQEGVYKLK